MTTTTHRAVPGRDDLVEVKRRRRRENLLYTRKRVATLAAEYRSHGLDDAIELYQLQLEVEQVIADECPDEFCELVVDWAEQEAQAEHHPASMSPDCTLCAAIAMDETNRTTGRYAA